MDLKSSSHIKDHHVSSRSKVKGTKVKNVIILVFSLVSEKLVRGQGNERQRSEAKASGSSSKLLAEFPAPSTRGRC